MLFCKVDCPHCGNEISVTNAKPEQKCQFCRRIVKVTIWRKGRKVNCEVEAVDFNIQNQNQRKDKQNGFKGN